MSWLNDLRKGVAVATAAESGGVLTFLSTGTYPAGQVGIYGMLMPPTPDEAVALHLYPLTDDLEVVVGVQFKYRAATEDRLGVIEECLFDSWRQRGADTLNGVSMILCSWSSGAALGQDSNGRLTRTANFYMTAHRALPDRT